MNSRTLERMFGYVAPTPEEARKCGVVRCNCKELARTLNANLPECAEKTRAIALVREAMFQAYAAIRTTDRVTQVEPVKEERNG